MIKKNGLYPVLGLLSLSMPYAFANENYLLPEITTKQVSADKINAFVTSTAINSNGDTVTSISQKEIKQSGAQTVTQALNLLSSVENYSQTSGSSLFYIHGLRAEILINGQPLSSFDNSAPNIDIIPIDAVTQIDVITNGDSTLYGNGALSGVINIITEIKHTEITLTPSYPRFGRVSASLAQNLSDQTKLGILQSLSDQYGDRSHQNTQNSQTLFSLNHKYQSGEINTQASFYSLNSQFPGSLTEAQYNDDPYQAGFGWEIYNQRISQIQTKWQQDITDTQSISTHLDYRQINAKGLFAYSNDYFNQSYQTVGISPNYQFFTTSDDLTKSIKFNQGIDYRYEFFDNTNVINQAYRQTLSPYFNTNETMNSWQFSQGGRYSFIADRGSFIDYSNNSVRNNHSNQNLFAANLSVGYRFNEITTSQLKLSHNFQAPFIDQSDYTPNIQSDFGLNATTSNNLTFSQIIKTKQLQLAISPYLMWVDNQIAFDPSIQRGSFQGANTNLPPIFQYGLDTNLEYQISESIKVGNNSSITVARFRSGSLADGTNLKGNDVPSVPVFQSSFYSNIKLCENLNWFLNANYRGTSYAEGDLANNLRKTQSYWLFNTAFNLDEKPWLFSLQINNIFNTHYAMYVTANGNSLSYYPGDSISASFSVTYQFH